MNQERVKLELSHCLEEWGVNGSHNNNNNSSNDRERNAKFKNHVLRAGVSMFNAKNEKSTFEHLVGDRAFPTSYEQAYRYVLEHDVEGFKRSVKYKIVDKLAAEVRKEGREMRGSSLPMLAPYYRWYSKRKPSEVIEYRRKKMYARFSDQDLDPFNRFTYLLGRKESEYLFERWFCCSKDATYGTVLEATLACYALQNQVPCLSCHALKTLRWNGGFGTSFMDIVCTFCNSTYEVKTKADMEKCESQFERNYSIGGSYRGYWGHRNAMTKDQKMYLVVLPRDWTMGRNGKQYRPVFCMEIDDVLPRLSSASFWSENPPKRIKRAQRDTLVVQSYIKTKISTKKKWFDLPKSCLSFDVDEIIRQVYIKSYSLAEYNRLNTILLSSEDQTVITATQSLTAGKRKKKGDNRKGQKPKKNQSDKKHFSKDALTAKLDQLKLKNEEECEDWEEMYSDTSEHEDKVPLVKEQKRKG